MNRITEEDKFYIRFLYNLGFSKKRLQKELGKTWLQITRVVDKDKANTHVGKWRDENREKISDYIRNYQRDWLKTDKGRAHSIEKEHRRRMLKCNTPDVVLIDGVWMEIDRDLTFKIWGETFLLPYDERQKIKDLANRCRQRTKRTGVKHNLDHIQPLAKGGLHASWNMQIITEEENLQKGDNFRLEDQKLLAWRLLIK